MNAILTSLIHLARRTGLFTEEEMTAAYNWLWIKLGCALAVCAVAFLLNVSFGWKLPSLLFALVFAIVAFYVWAKPLHVLGVAGTGLVAKIVTHADIATEVEKVLGIYLELLKWVLIVGGVFLLTTGTFSFKGNPVAGLSLLVSLGVVGLFIWKWPDVFVGTWGRRFFYTSALLIAIFSFMSIIPGPVWTKYTGWDPLTAKPTNTEEALYRLNQKRREIADTDRATELERITGKIIRHEALTQAEERFIAEAEQVQSNKKSSSQQAQQLAKPMLTMSANGDSARISPDAGYVVVFTGSGFEHHVVYADGNDCVVGNTVNPCRDGPILHQYVRDTTGKFNSVTYKFVR